MAWLEYLRQNATLTAWREQGGLVAVAFRLRLRQVEFIFENAQNFETDSDAAADLATV